MCWQNLAQNWIYFCNHQLINPPYRVQRYVSHHKKSQSQTFAKEYDSRHKFSKKWSLSLLNLENTPSKEFSMIVSRFELQNPLLLYRFKLSSVCFY